MCTAVSFLPGDHYFGRNLDLEYCYRETVTVTPRQFPFAFRHLHELKEHYALIGMATIADSYPLYYDATNEMGLSMAGLNFPGNAFYQPVSEHRDSIAPFELIPWVLGQCANVHQALALLENSVIAATAFSDSFPLSDLHWILSDRERSVTLEPLQTGLSIQENPVGVLTNNPPFDYHLHNLQNYMTLTNEVPENRLAPRLKPTPYSRGMGAMGLPGDLSSASRFVRAVFTKEHSVRPQTESAAVSQFFHILGSVVQQDGCVRVGDGFERTVYSSCCNTDKCIYYYTTYENSQISAVHLFHEDLDSAGLVDYPLLRGQQIRMEN